MAVYTQHRNCLLVGDYDWARIDESDVGDFVTRISPVSVCSKYTSHIITFLLNLRMNYHKTMVILIVFVIMNVSLKFN